MPQIGYPHVPDDTPSMEDQADALRVNAIARLEREAARLRNRIQQIRIDYPEAADALRVDLAGIESEIRRIKP